MGLREVDERRRYLNNCGFGQAGIVQPSPTGAHIGEVLRERGSEVQKQEH